MTLPVARPVRRLTGRHVLFLLLAFFAAVFAVNGVFIYVSLQSHPGVVSDDAYRRGLHYNRELDRAERQRDMGWRSRVSVVGGTVELTVSGPAGMPVAGLAVSGTARRPVHDRSDRTLIFTETAPGIYRAAPPGLPAGRWSLVLETVAPDRSAFRIDRTVRVEE